MAAVSGRHASGASCACASRPFRREQHEQQWRCRQRLHAAVAGTAGVPRAGYVPDVHTAVAATGPAEEAARLRIRAAVRERYVKLK
ncbi:hypothetical protein HK405_013852, partial [Cladochytrium tenue]